MSAPVFGEDQPLINVEVFFPEYPFGGVLVEMPGEAPIQVEFGFGGSVSSVFGRTGAVQPQCDDYDQCYAPKEAGLPEGGDTHQVLRKKTNADYDTEWVTPSSGGGGGEISVVGEVPSGVINGANNVFTTANPFTALEVYYNGLRVHEAIDYIISGASAFQMIYPPLPGDQLLIDYLTT